MLLGVSRDRYVQNGVRNTEDLGVDRSLLSTGTT